MINELFLSHNLSLYTDKCIVMPGRGKGMELLCMAK
jgi:hypothetical protein